jgi:PQQ-like domain
MLVRRIGSSIAAATFLVLLFASSPASAGGGGTQLWAKLYGPRQGGAVAVATSPDGSKVFVTGTLRGGAPSDFGTVAYDASTGAMLWGSAYDGPAGAGDEAFDLAVSPDGSKVFVTGWTRAGASFDYATVAYDAANGSQLWDAIYAGPAGGWDMATSVAADPDGSLVFVTGRSDGATTTDYATVAYDSTTGARVWVARYRNGQATDVTTSPDGSTVYVTGTASNAAGTDYATVAYQAATGTQVWATRLDGGPQAEAKGIAASSDGSKVFVTGSVVRGGDWDYATVGYDAATGAQLWARAYNGPASRSDQAAAVGAAPDGSAVYVTGYSYAGRNTTQDDYTTLAYDASTGTQLWLQRDARPGFDDPTSLAVSPAGSEVFVTGRSEGPNLDDYLTEAYDAATGAVVWSSRYDGPGHGTDQATSIAACPSGARVFVTGSTFGLSGRYVYGTVAYAA